MDDRTMIRLLIVVMFFWMFIMAIADAQAPHIHVWLCGPQVIQGELMEVCTCPQDGATILKGRYNA